MNPADKHSQVLNLLAPLLDMTVIFIVSGITTLFGWPSELSMTDQLGSILYTVKVSGIMKGRKRLGTLYRVYNLAGVEVVNLTQEPKGIMIASPDNILLGTMTDATWNQIKYTVKNTLNAGTEFEINTPQTTCPDCCCVPLTINNFNVSQASGELVARINTAHFNGQFGVHFESGVDSYSKVLLIAASMVVYTSFFQLNRYGKIGRSGSRRFICWIITIVGLVLFSTILTTTAALLYLL